MHVMIKVKRRKMGVGGTCLPVGIDSQVGTSTCKKKDIARILRQRVIDANNPESRPLTYITYSQLARTVLPACN